MIAATLLLIMEEDEAFWTLRAMIRLRLPLDYYSKSLSGVMADQHVGFFPPTFMFCSLAGTFYDSDPTFLTAGFRRAP